MIEQELTLAEIEVADPKALSTKHLAIAISSISRIVAQAEDDLVEFLRGYNIREEHPQSPNWQNRMFLEQELQEVRKRQADLKREMKFRSHMKMVREKVAAQGASTNVRILEDYLD